MGVKKYFIAIVIPEPAFSIIEAIKQKLFCEHGLKGALRSPAHITLHRPFVWKEDKQDVLIARLGNINFEAGFEIELKGFAFFEPRVVYVNVLPNEMLNALHYKLKQVAKKELNLFNEWEDVRGFCPHVTIAHRDLKKPMFYCLQKEFTATAFNARFTPNCISLLKLEKNWEEVRQFTFGN